MPWLFVKNNVKQGCIRNLTCNCFIYVFLFVKDSFMVGKYTHIQAILCVLYFYIIRRGLLLSKSFGTYARIQDVSTVTYGHVHTEINFLTVKQIYNKIGI